MSCFAAVAMMASETNTTLKIITAFMAVAFLGVGLGVLITFFVKHRLQRMAYEDNLTDLSTLHKFKLDAKKKLKCKESGRFMVVAFDIDNFKYINDIFDYSIGNDVLRTVAAYFKIRLEDGDLLARSGSDNFLIFTEAVYKERYFNEFNHLEELVRLLQSMLSSRYNLSFSGGIYIVKDALLDIDAMIDNANTARKTAKLKNGTHLLEYSEKMEERVEWQKEVTVSLESAIANNEFVIYLQPKISLVSGGLRGAEALVRWNHPEKGLMAPGSFIPILEKNGSIIKLDLYMFEEVCRYVKKWADMGCDCENKCRISVNLSRPIVEEPRITEELYAIVNKYKINPKFIEIELTESVAVDNYEKFTDVMFKLKNIGFMVAIDDFGSGYSSLNILKNLPVDTLKMDKEFLGDTENIAKSKIIVESVIQMAKNLKLETIAEGVETYDQVDVLTRMGCDMAQGFYFFKPMTVIDFETELIEKRRAFADEPAEQIHQKNKKSK